MHKVIGLAISFAALGGLSPAQASSLGRPCTAAPIEHPVHEGLNSLWTVRRPLIRGRSA